MTENQKEKMDLRVTWAPTLWRGVANLGPYSDVHMEGLGPFYPTRQSLYVKNHVTVLEILV